MLEAPEASDSWYLSTIPQGASSTGIITIMYHINHGVHSFIADCKENELAPETRRLHQQYPCCKRDEGTCGQRRETVWSSSSSTLRLFWLCSVPSLLTPFQPASCRATHSQVCQLSVQQTKTTASSQKYTKQRCYTQETSIRKTCLLWYTQEENYYPLTLSSYI